MSGGDVGFGAYGTINDFVNTNLITGPSFAGVYIGGNTGTLTNTGTITGLYAGIYTDSMGGALGILDNQQGASGSALIYGDVLPSKYNIIIAGTTNYGQLSASLLLGVSGTTTFGISSLSTTNTSILNTQLTSVLSGVASSKLLNTSGTSNGYTFELSETTSGSGIWNLLC